MSVCGTRRTGDQQGVHLIRLAWFLCLLAARTAAAPFGPGELLVFDLKWQFVRGGVATMSIHPVPGDTSLWQIRTRARSVGVLDVFYTVRDTLSSTIRRSTLLPVRYEKLQHEGWYHRDSTYVFDQDRNTVARFSRGRHVGVLSLPGEVHDILSSLYRVRSSPLSVGSHMSVRVYEGGKLYNARVNVLRREQVTVPAGTFSCVVVEPILQSEAIFVQKGRLWIWLTDDARRLPVLMESAIPVGTIRAELVSFLPGSGTPGSGTSGSGSSP